MTRLTPTTPPILLIPVYFCPTAKISAIPPYIFRLSQGCIRNPSVGSLFQAGTNEQYIHQKFDHQSIDMIIKMKNQHLMTGMPSNICQFHDSYTCHICLPTKSCCLSSLMWFLLTIDFLVTFYFLEKI